MKADILFSLTYFQMDIPQELVAKRKNKGKKEKKEKKLLTCCFEGGNGALAKVFPLGMQSHCRYCSWTPSRYSGRKQRQVTSVTGKLMEVYYFASVTHLYSHQGGMCTTILFFYPVYFCSNFIRRLRWGIHHL